MIALTPQLQPPHQRPIRKIVARENVYVDALMDKRVFRMIFFDAGRVVSAQLENCMGQCALFSRCT